MMGVYVKGMEMPDRCFSCPMCDTDCCGISRGSYIEYRDIDVDVAMNGRPDWCPLVPVPPHGDLIDYEFCMENYELLHDDDWNPVYAVRMRDINNAPTIIPAEEEQT